MIPNHQFIKELLDKKVFEYNRQEFIPEDPVSIPHRFNLKEDIEISGFLTAIISWGNRRTILQNAGRLMEMMDHSPYDFILHHGDHDLLPFKDFRHRTFNGDDCIFFIDRLGQIYRDYGDLENAFLHPQNGIYNGILNFRRIFLAGPHPGRSEKHLADPSKGSSAKRINMFLRWMVRRDASGVDFGIWKSVRPSELFCPLDVHTGETARRLGILSVSQNNWKAVEQLTGYLRTLDPDDPVRYDFALFGIGRYG